MMNDARISYRWQDHVITPQRTAANLMVTALVVLAVGAGVLFAGSGGAAPPRPLTAHAVGTERTPPLSELARRPAPPHTTQDFQ
jgi:hypothetical protein